MPRFETMLAEVSARFINLPAEQVDDAIVDAQRRVCECLGLDVIVLWQWEVDAPGVFTLTHHYRRGEGPPLTRQVQAAEFFPWGLRQVLAGRSYLLASLDDVPEGAERDRDSLRHFGVQNGLTLCLAAGGGAPFGAISFHDVVAPRAWSDALLHRLELVAQILANAILRKRSDQALKENEVRLTLAADSAGMGLWSLDLATDRYWLTDKNREIFGFGPQEEVTLERVLEAVYPEDREMLRQTIQAVTASRKEDRVEYRIVRPEGTMRWMVSHGRVHGPPGKPPTHLMGVTIDATQSKLAGESLKQSEFRLAAAMDVAELGFYEVTNGDRVTFLDRRAREIIGASVADEEAGRIFEFWGRHVHPEELSRVMELNRALNEGAQDRLTVDYRFLNPERGVIFIHHLVHVIERDADGCAVRTIGVLQDITERKKGEEDLRKAIDEIRQLRDRLQVENVYLREQIRSEAGHGAIVGESEEIQRMLALAEKVAPTDSAVLITGETGTGKELLAQAIHDLSPRKAKPMVKVNCAALPAPLIESELFGREKGAYTGAMTQQIGRFEIAHGSTIFLDEIGDLPMELQAKLLRVLQDGQFERLGGRRTIKADVRVIAATNRNLSAMIGEGRFREDLFHRLNVFPIEVPPLRARVSDIPMLVWKFVQEFNTRMGRAIDSISKPTMDQLKQYPWPGNVRELRNVIERAMIVSDGRSLRVELAAKGADTASPPSTLEDMERAYILRVLERTHWRISGKGGAAEILGILPTTLHSRMKKLGISRPKS